MKSDQKMKINQYFENWIIALTLDKGDKTLSLWFKHKEFPSVLNNYGKASEKVEEY